MISKEKMRSFMKFNTSRICLNCCYYRNAVEFILEDYDKKEDEIIRLKDIIKHEFSINCLDKQCFNDNCSEPTKGCDDCKDFISIDEWINNKKTIDK